MVIFSVEREIRAVTPAKKSLITGIQQPASNSLRRFIQKVDFTIYSENSEFVRPGNLHFAIELRMAILILSTTP